MGYPLLTAACAYKLELLLLVSVISWVFSLILYRKCKRAEVALKVARKMFTKYLSLLDEENEKLWQLLPIKKRGGQKRRQVHPVI